MAQTIINKYNKLTEELNEKRNNGERLHENHWHNVNNSLFHELVENKHYEEAEKMFHSYISRWDNPSAIYDRYPNDIRVFEMALKNRVGPPYNDCSRFCTNLEITKLFTKYDIIKSSSEILRIISNSDDYNIVEFILDNYKSKIIFTHPAPGNPQKLSTYAKTPKILEMLINSFGQNIIINESYDPRKGICYTNPYINKPEFMKVILKKIPNYNYTLKDIEDITNIDHLIEINHKKYGVSNNELWNKYKNRGHVILHNRNVESPIWVSSINKKLFKFSDDDKKAIDVYFYNICKDKDYDKHRFIVGQNRIIMIRYAMYCIINKHDKGLEYAISKTKTIIKSKNIQLSKRMNDCINAIINIVVNYSDELPKITFVELAARLQNMNAVEILRKNGADMESIKNVPYIKKQIYLKNMETLGKLAGI